MQTTQEPHSLQDGKPERIPGRLSCCETQDIKVNDRTYCRVRVKREMAVTKPGSDAILMGTN